jgi:hypothetical protein
MPFVKGRGITVRVANVMGTPVTVSGVTKANPGVVTATAHGQTDGTIGFITAAAGMVQLDGQAVRVDAPVSATFSLQGLDTTSYSDWSGSGTFTPVTSWHTLAEADQYNLGGGEAAEIDTTCLIDVIGQSENGNLASESVTINIKSQDVPSAGLQAIINAARAGASLVFSIVLPNGSVRVFRGEPSKPGESVSVNAVGTGSFTIRVKGTVLSLAA